LTIEDMMDAHMFAVWSGWLSLIAAMATALHFCISQCTQAAQTHTLQSNAANNTSRNHQLLVSPHPPVDSNLHRLARDDGPRALRLPDHALGSQQLELAQPPLLFARFCSFGFFDLRGMLRRICAGDGQEDGIVVGVSTPPQSP
jgi:hypothetical protein